MKHSYNLQELYVEFLKDIYDAEKQLLKALPLCAKAASHSELRKTFEKHFAETQDQVERLERIFGQLALPSKAAKCLVMEGLIQECRSIIDLDAPPFVRDAALIAVAQKIEHYEIATYGCLCVWAKTLGFKEHLKMLKDNISEEKDADDDLSSIAESTVNEEAAATSR